MDAARQVFGAAVKDSRPAKFDTGYVGGPGTEMGWNWNGYYMFNKDQLVTGLHSSVYELQDLIDRGTRLQAGAPQGYSMVLRGLVASLKLQLEQARSRVKQFNPGKAGTNKGKAVGAGGFTADSGPAAFDVGSIAGHDASRDEALYFNKGAEFSREHHPYGPEVRAFFFDYYERLKALLIRWESRDLMGSMDMARGSVIEGLERAAEMGALKAVQTGDEELGWLEAVFFLMRDPVLTPYYNW